MRSSDRANRATSQLPLPLPSKSALSRSDFIIAPANANAISFIDAWPDWPFPAVCLFGPSGCGKTHVASIWQERSGAQIIAAAQLCSERPGSRGALVIEDVDSAEATAERDAALFEILENSGIGAPLLLTSHQRPTDWACVLPDLASRFRALTALPLWAPDDELLGALARKLFADRQLVVPEAIIAHILRLLERSPAAIRDFVAEADAVALAQARPVNLPLVRAVIAARECSAP